MAKLTKIQRKALREKVRREMEVPKSEFTKLNSIENPLEPEPPLEDPLVLLTLHEAFPNKPSAKVVVTPEQSGEEEIHYVGKQGSFLAQLATSFRDILGFFFRVLGIFLLLSHFDGILDHLALLGRFWLGLLLWLYDSFCSQL